MAIENKISITIPETDLQAAADAINTAREILAPYLIALTPKERMILSKMSDGTRPFVEKFMDYVPTEPSFLPRFVPVEEMQKDWKSNKKMDSVYKSAMLLCNDLNDTMMLAGSEVYEASLAYYNSVKIAARMRAPNA
ncbi:hypothetical protein JYB62_03780 [Algoriphagus lutimaris]|uniref:hypothetical protein n=1 Tax=Algoriphagus lutimaris TaxID=613197 RepID=UPI00196AE183|nr:hypothetical protein [Algoriphagus lutimaris]MBN3519113.1 hypothetical protein [Algoriphagus lutimaris]